MTGQDPRLKSGSIPGITLSEPVWQALIIVSTVVVLLVSFYCLSHGITIIFMHLFYFPIILLAYHYRYRGFLIATLIALGYVWLVYLFQGGEFDVIVGAWLRFLVFAGVAAVVAYLSEHLSSDQVALQESEKKYRTLFENMLEGFAYCRMIYDDRGRPVDWVYLDVNAAFERVTGLKNIKGKRVLEAIPDIQRLTPELFDTNGRVASTGTPESFEINFLPLKMWLKVSVFSPEKGYFVAVFEDITGRKQAEDAFKASEEKVREHVRFLQQLIDTIPNPIFYKDKNGRYTGCNTAFERYIGISKDNLVGKSVYDISPKDLADIYYAKDKQLLDNRGTQVYEAAVKYADNSRHDVIFNKASLTDLEGNVHGLVGVIIDITDRKRVEEEIRQTRDFYLKVLDDFPNPIWRADVHAKCDYFNKDWLLFTGRTLEQELGDGWAEGIHPEDFDRCLKIYLDSFHARIPFEMEYRLRYHDGTYHWLYDSGKPFYTLAGEFAGYIGSCYDIQGRRQAEEALHQVNKKLNLLSGITRHDINNQLFSLKAFLELSKESLDDTVQTAQYLLKAEQAANAIERQIAFTKEYQDLGVKAPVWQDVGMGVKNAVAALPMRAVRVLDEAGDIIVFADPLLEKVFYNLVDNALRYGGSTMTKIRITSRESGQGLVISVEDDGMGISPEDKKRLFERGFGHHTGLGLFLSREILAITGITITETGESGMGARFEIAVPKGAWRYGQRGG